MNWQNLMDRLAPLRRQWDLAVLANLAAGTERPSDLIEAINAQATNGRRIGWKVLNDTLRRLERSGYVARQEMQSVPRETRYWLRPPGHRLLAALRLLDTWYDEHEPGDDSRRRADGREPERQRRGRPRPPLPRSLNAGTNPARCHRQDEHAGARSHQPYPVPATRSARWSSGTGRTTAYTGNWRILESGSTVRRQHQHPAAGPRAPRSLSSAMKPPVLSPRITDALS